MDKFKLFKLFLWKNWRFMWYNKCALGIINVTAVVLIFLYLKAFYKITTSSLSTSESQNMITLRENSYPVSDDSFLLYAPQSVFLDKLMSNVQRELQLYSNNLKSFENYGDMKLFSEQQRKSNCFSVHFESFPDAPTANTNHSDFQFSISSSAMRISPKKIYVNDEEIADVKDYDDYMRSGFFALQHLIDKNYIKENSAQFEDYDIEIQPMRHIVTETVDSQRMIYFGSLFAILFNVLLLSTFLVPLVEEKQDGIKEFLITATPLNFLNGVTFFLLRFIYYIVFITLVLISAWIYKAVGISPIGYVILLFLLYTISGMSYAYLLSVCFHSVFYAKVGGLVLLVMPYIFHVVPGGISIIATYFFSTQAFMKGISALQIFTNKHRIFGFDDLFENITDSSFSIASIYMLLIVQSLIYALLYYYLSSVFPGCGGLKKPYLFFLQPSFYKKQQRNEYTTTERGSDAIIIQDLVKVFKTPSRNIVIADRINMGIKSKQITVLLGHNGAGKTTTLNMIMGSVPKDSGKIIVCSERDVSSYRHLIGFCPQHSVFMNYLTCFEHLQFFAQLRGVTEEIALVEELLLTLNLQDKANSYPNCLSGGMKRRLSLGIALAGETKVIVLDEPSSGLDIESRRQLWDLLLELRKTKTILVTTHYMEEAEVLGDTIAILANGSLQVHGTPLELKRKHGSGYVLKMSSVLEEINKQEEMKIMNIVRSHVYNAEKMNDIPPTLHISLPYAFKDRYSSTLRELERQSKELQIQNISISDSSLEEVFLNCAAKLSPEVSFKMDFHNDKPIIEKQSTSVSWLQQFIAVIYKKYIYLRKEFIFTFLMILIPVLSIIGAILLMKSKSFETIDDVFPLKLSSLKKGIIYTRYDVTNDVHARVESILKRQIVNYNEYEYRHLELRANHSVHDELIALQHENLPHFLQNVIGVIEIFTNDADNIVFKTYFSSNIYHSTVILLNIIDNTMLQYQHGSEDQQRINTNYAPIRRLITDVSSTSLEYYAFIVPIGMFFCVFFYTSLPFREHMSGFKTLQPMRIFHYWSAVFLFDVFIYLLICICLFCLQILLMPKDLYSTDELLLIMMSIFFYGLSYLPILYFFANAFRSISTIATYLLFMLIISAVTPLITSGNTNSMHNYETTILILSILPDFNLNHQLRIINEKFILTRQRKQNLYYDELNENRFFWFAIVVFTLVTLFFIRIWENREKRESLIKVFSCCYCRCGKPSSRTMQKPEDWIPLQAEREETAVDGNGSENYPLLVKNLCKAYDHKIAVSDLSLKVKKRECFGLLGVNGAGKTSTFQMITANETISSGTVQIEGVDLLKDEAKYKSLFGYCPQYDCLNDFMTAYQTLTYMARLRGLSGKCLKDSVDYWLEKLDLHNYKHCEIRHYSGGTKRKLSAAVAMIGNPALVLLDEPTTGVDPVSRRFLWKCIKEIQQEDKTFVLTSHSMDECEHLCNRLAIMADGKFKCIGNVPELKQSYGSGFTIKMKLKQDDSEEYLDLIYDALKEQFHGCRLRENHAGMATFVIENYNNKIPWSKIFQQTEEFFAKTSDLIEDYSVNESTLEDIFLSFEPQNKNLTSSIE